jgi:hypothetical protein
VPYCLFECKEGHEEFIDKLGGKVSVVISVRVGGGLTGQIKIMPYIFGAPVTEQVPRIDTVTCSDA